MENSIFARAFFIFWHFEDVLVLSVTWNDQFCSCVDDVSIWWQMFNFVFLCPKRWLKFNFKVVRTHLFANAQLLKKGNPPLSLLFVLKVKVWIFSFRPRVALDSTAKSNVVKSNDQVVCKSVDPDLETKVHVDESFASATNEVTPQSKSLDPSTDQHHPNSTATHF